MVKRVFGYDILLPMQPPEIDLSAYRTLLTVVRLLHLKFSNGCAIGCDTCDGTSRGPLPFEGNGSKWRGCSKRDASGKWMSKCNLCPEAHAKATICDPKLRTINSDAPCGSSTDYYYYSPWRAPYGQWL